MQFPRDQDQKVVGITCDSMAPLALIGRVARDLGRSPTAGGELAHVHYGLNGLGSQKREGLQLPGRPRKFVDKILRAGVPLLRQPMRDPPDRRDLLVGVAGSGNGGFAILALCPPPIQARETYGDGQRQDGTEGLRPCGLTFVGIHPRTDVRDVAKSHG